LIAAEITAGDGHETTAASELASIGFEVGFAGEPVFDSVH
jgi:hypothetical protein